MSTRIVFLGHRPGGYQWQQGHGPEQLVGKLPGGVPYSEHDFCGGHEWVFESCDPDVVLEFLHDEALSEDLVYHDRSGPTFESEALAD